MSHQHEVVIKKGTGNADRDGFCDFANDGSFDAATEEIRTDAPQPVKIEGDAEETKMDRYTAALGWHEVDQP